MLKKFTVCAVVALMLVLPGCSGKSNVQTHSDNSAKEVLYQSNATKESLKYGFKALTKIMEFYEEQVVREEVKQAEKTLFRYTQFDKTGKKVIGTYEVADVTSGYVSIINNMTISQSRERIVREFAPIFEDITTRMIERGDAPKSWIDVASEFVEHTPLLASIGGMYGLGVAGIDAASSQITATLSGNSKLNSNSTTSGDTTTAPITEIAEPAVEE